MPGTTETKQYRASYDWQKEHIEKHCRDAGIAETCVQPIIEVLLPQYAKADATAIHYQNLFNRAAVAVYALSAAAVTVAILQLLLAPHLYGLIGIEVGVMIAALFLIRLSRQKKWKRSWLDARHLAEQLRSAMFVLIVPGEQKDNNLRPVQVLPFYSAPDPTLQESVRKALEDERLRVCAFSDIKAVKKFIASAWIKDQAVFHRNNADKRHAKSHRLHEWAVILFVVTLFAAAMHALGIGHDEPHDHITFGTVVGLITVLFTIALPAWASALHGIGDLFEHERIAERSTRMADVLDEIAKRIDASETMEDVRKLADEAAWVMAIENYEWLVSLGFRHTPSLPA